MATSKKTVSQDTDCVNLQELEEEYEKDLLKDLLTEAGGSTTLEKEGSSQGKRTKTKKIPFLRKHIPQLEKLDFEEPEKQAGVKFDEDQQQQILDHINTYHRDSTTWTKGAAPDEARRCMKDTAKAANKLSTLLSRETPKKHAIVDHYWPFKDISPTGFRLTLAQIEVSAKDAADDISTGPGNPGNPHIYTLVRRLHNIWTQAGGTGRCSYWVPLDDGYSGAFFFFVQEIIKQADLPPRNPAGIHKTIVAAVPST